VIEQALKSLREVKLETKQKPKTIENGLAFIAALDQFRAQ
jgi:hypothetical protein